MTGTGGTSTLPLFTPTVLKGRVGVGTRPRFFHLVPLVTNFVIPLDCLRVDPRESDRTGDGFEGTRSNPSPPVVRHDPESVRRAHKPNMSETSSETGILGPTDFSHLRRVVIGFTLLWVWVSQKTEQ